jgi:hypothetical protein
MYHVLLFLHALLYCIHLHSFVLLPTAWELLNLMEAELPLSHQPVSITPHPLITMSLISG